MLKLRDFELICYKTYADLRAETERTYMGFLWWLLDPIIFMGIFYVVFGVLLNRGTEDFVTFLLIGLASWRWFQNTVMHGTSAILGNGGIMRQAYLPKIVFPIVTALTDLVKFIFVFSMLLLYLWFSGAPAGATYIALPLILVVQFVLIVAVTCLVAALVPFFPDLKILVDHTLHVMLFLSGVFFSGSSIPSEYQPYFYLNPMATILDSYRSVLMYDRWPDIPDLALIGLLAVLANAGAYLLLARWDKLYPKVVP